MQSDLDDDMLKVACDEESEEGMMQNESDNETSTVSNQDTFSSSDDGNNSDDADDSNEGERSEEINDSDEEADPWEVLLQEAAEIRTKHSELVQSFEEDEFSGKQTFLAIFSDVRKEMGDVYLDRLQWMSQVKRDLVHRKIMKTRDAFVGEGEFDPDDVLITAGKGEISLRTYVRRQTALP